jgi:hypothetical protein
MSWQWPLVILVIVLAAVYLARQTWRTWTGSKSGGCGGGCSCSKATATPNQDGVTLVPVEQVKLLRRPPAER